jgi:hypothetical protein
MYQKRRLQEGYNIRMHRTRGHRNVELFPIKTFTHVRYFLLQNTGEPGLHIAICEVSLPKHRQHQDPPSPAHCHANNERERSTPQTCRSQSRRPRGPPFGPDARRPQARCPLFTSLEPESDRYLRVRQDDHNTDKSDEVNRHKTRDRQKYSR